MGASFGRHDEASFAPQHGGPRRIVASTSETSHEVFPTEGHAARREEDHAFAESNVEVHAGTVTLSQHDQIQPVPGRVSP